MGADFLAGPDGPADPDSIDVPVTERGVVTGRDGVRRRQQGTEFLGRPKYHHARCLATVAAKPRRAASE